MRFLRRYELLGDVGLGIWHWGLYEERGLTSVVSFGTTGFSGHRGFIAEIGKVAHCGVVQLCRGATTAFSHPHAASYLVSRACQKMYHAKGPLIIVAYANPVLGEIGTIYQACNAIYTGMTNPKGQANYIVNNKLLSGWVVRKKFGTRDQSMLKKIDAGFKVIPLIPKHRYVMLACSKLRKRKLLKLFESYKLPYPHR